MFVKTREKLLFLDHVKKVAGVSLIKAGTVQFSPKLPGLNTAATTTNSVTQPRGKKEGGESYLIQVLVRPEVAGKVTDIEGKYGQFFPSKPVVLCWFLVGEIGWVRWRRRRRRRRNWVGQVEEEEEEEEKLGGSGGRTKSELASKNVAVQ
ncbi:hypothetical protein L3X38_010922 [Prunus dulcis]|uniref:Uncharacterized protein n=1 Tax=Prunus dulcis TaxID=3755 RepID=A0AAD4WH49_PRUDU|nr:hypothetical protein L3X38_010922 [Prunus dulcis]